MATFAWATSTPWNRDICKVSGTPFFLIWTNSSRNFFLVVSSQPVIPMSVLWGKNFFSSVLWGKKAVQCSPLSKILSLKPVQFSPTHLLLHHGWLFWSPRSTQVNYHLIDFLSSFSSVNFWPMSVISHSANAKMRPNEQMSKCARTKIDFGHIFMQCCVGNAAFITF